MVRRDGTLPVHIFTVTRPRAINGKALKDTSPFEILVPGGYLDRQAALDLLRHHLPAEYCIAPISTWRGDLSCVDHQRHDLDNYANPAPGKGMKRAA